MRGEWEKHTLKEVGVGLIDCVHKTPADAGVGYPYIAIPQMKEGRIDFNANPRLISEDDFREWTKKANPQENDVVLSRRCNPGETAYVPQGVKFALGQNLVLLRSNGDKLFPPLLRWLTKGPQWWGQVEQYLNVGAVFDSLKCADIPNFELLIPPYEKQKAIAHILGTLDDKIELNRQMNATLEAMAQALFKSWFVDFDPVIDKALAAGNPIPEPLQERAAKREALGNKRKKLPVDVVKHFPDRFVETEEMGWVPEGWEVGVVGDICAPCIGGQWGSDNPGERLVPAICLRGADMESLRIKGYAPDAPVRYLKRSAIEKRLPNKNDILVAGSGAGPCGRPLWFADAIHNISEYPVLYSNFVKRFSTKGQEYAMYLDRILMDKYVDRSIEDFITGTSVPNLDANGLLSACSILIPNSGILKVYASYLEYIYAKLYSEENQILEKIRDTLLPKLLSGELCIPDAENLVGKAV